MRERINLFFKRNWRFLLFIFAGVLILTGAYITKSYRTAPKSGATVEAATGLGSYTVKKGDSIFSIAGKFGVAIAALKHVNGLDKGTLSPGQVLTIPDQPSDDWYTVKHGDSLYHIAAKYNVTPDRLQIVNGLDNAFIKPGQVLLIPSAKTASTKVEPVKPPVGPSHPASEYYLGIPAQDLPLAEVLKGKGIDDPWSRISILIDKSAHTLSLYAGGAWLKSYPAEFGDGGLDDKRVRGDHKTPEGNFYVAEKSVLKPADKFLGTRWLRLSYPNIEDAERGIRQGLIDQKTCNAIIEAWKNKAIPPQYTALGGGVGIHGGNSKEQGSNWTWGCVGLNNKDIEDFFDFVAVGTPITIQN
jgi:LysM repeat protein